MPSLKDTTEQRRRQGNYQSDPITLHVLRLSRRQALSPQPILSSADQERRQAALRKLLDEALALLDEEAFDEEEVILLQ